MARGQHLLAALLLALAGAAPAARADAPTADEIVARAGALGVGDEAQQLRSRFLPGLRMLGGGSDTLGATRIGGRPDLAAGVRWPACGRSQRLSFLMQVRLTDLGIRRRGTLALFADLHEDEEGITHIELFDGPMKRNSCVTVRVSRGPLARRATPPGVHTLRSVPVRLRPTLTIPGWELAESLLGGRRPDPFFDRWLELTDESAWGVLGHKPPFRPIHQLLGWSFPVQYDPTTYCGGVVKSPRVLLLQLDWDLGIDFAIGDGGALFITIPPGDLRKGRFNRLCGEFQEG